MHFSSEIQLSLFGTLWPGVHGLQKIDGDVPTLWDRGWALQQSYGQQPWGLGNLNIQLSRSLNYNELYGYTAMQSVGIMT